MRLQEKFKIDHYSTTWKGRAMRTTQVVNESEELAVLFFFLPLVEFGKAEESQCLNLELFGLCVFVIEFRSHSVACFHIVNTTESRKYLYRVKTLSFRALALCQSKWPSTLIKNFSYCFFPRHLQLLVHNRGLYHKITAEGRRANQKNRRAHAHGASLWAHARDFCVHVNVFHPFQHTR